MAACMVAVIVEGNRMDEVRSLHHGSSAWWNGTVGNQMAGEGGKKKVEREQDKGMEARRVSACASCRLFWLDDPQACLLVKGADAVLNNAAKLCPGSPDATWHMSMAADPSRRTPCDTSVKCLNSSMLAAQHSSCSYPTRKGVIILRFHRLLLRVDLHATLLQLHPPAAAAQ